jgi:hypothetical protein
MKQPSTKVLWLALIIGQAACATEREPSRQTAASVTPTVVPISSANYAFQAPDTVDAGWTTFQFANNGDDIHYAHIVQLDSGRTAEELLQAYAEAIRTSAARPKWIRRFGGPGGAAPGGSSAVTQNLEPGSYVWICPVEDSAGHPHFAKGESKPFVVRAATDPAGQAPPPVASAVIRLMDFTFAVDSQLTAGRHTIRVENTGLEPHDLVMMKLAPGETLEQVRSFLNPERARRPDEAGQPLPPLKSLELLAGGIAVIAPGMHVFFQADLTPGDYVLVCMTTAPDGRAHIEHGMIQQIRIQ